MAGLVLLPGLVAAAQPTGKFWRIGYLSSDAPADTKVALDAFRDSLRGLGYEESRNLTIEARYANGAYDHLPRLVDDLVRVKVDLLLTFGTRATIAAQNARSAIPIVFAFVVDPVGSGIVASLTRPGGTATGPSTLNDELNGKRLSFLKEIAPKAARVALLVNPSFPPTARLLAATRTAAKSLGFQVQLVEASRPDELEGAFGVMRSARAAALAVLPDSMLIGQGKRIVEFTNASRLPAITPWRQFPELGGLMSYGVNQATEFRRAARYVDRILKGAKPADLPVEQPTKFELVINLKTAKALGITIPSTLLALADELIR